MNRFLPIAKAFAFLLIAGGAAAAEVSFGPASKLWLEGDSTMHAFHSTATVMKVAGTWVSPTEVSGFTLTIPVDGLRSGKKALDANMQKALKSAAHPDIVFVLKELAVADGRVAAHGTLSVAGVDNEVELTGALEEANGLRLRGTKKLLMTDFGVKPPSMMMGTIKTRNEVVIHYDVFLEAR